jgi:class 3 adenylate cyclase
MTIVWPLGTPGERYLHGVRCIDTDDVMYLLNRYFAQVGELIERTDGYIDKFVGDGLMAISASEGNATRRADPLGKRGAANAGRGRLDEALFRVDVWDRLRYPHRFTLGRSVIGSIGSPGHERLTAIGGGVNVASRVEAANKEAGTRLLISRALYDHVKGEVEVADFIRVRLRGTSDRITLYEIKNLRPETERALNAVAARETVKLGG